MHLFVISVFLAKISNGSEVVIFSTDINNGIFGFLNPMIIYDAFLYLGLIATVIGSSGYVLCLLFYNPLVVTNSILLEPFVAQFLGYYLNIDQFPGLLTCFGSLITVFGLI